MKRAGTVAALVCLLLAQHDSAAATECDLADSFACHIRVVEQVQVRLDGSAAELGFERERVAASVRDRLRESLPGTVQVRLEPAASPGAIRLPPSRRGRLACTLWTVGKKFAVALFVECGMEAADASWAVESRLLGNVRRTELRESVESALAMVVGDVVRRLRRQDRTRPIVSTRADQPPIN